MINKFKGNLYNCGLQYGEHFKATIAGFFTQEFGKYKYSKKYVGSCKRQIQLHTPKTYRFLQGLAKSSLLNIEQHILLLLHEEELYHRCLAQKLPHCTVIAGSSGDNTLVGQNWDWSTAYLPWGHICHYNFSNNTRILALSFPGLPVCAGMNSHGLTLMWSGVGYYPPLMPKIGVPTYALCMEVLLCNNAKQAARILDNIPNAGAFAFVVGDKYGQMFVAESVPGKVYIKFTKQIHRSNIYELKEAAEKSRQKLPSFSKCSSLKRNLVLEKLDRTLLKKSSLNSIKAALSYKNIYFYKNPIHASLFQLLADCKNKKLHIRKWQDQEKWLSYSV